VVLWRGATTGNGICQINLESRLILRADERRMVCSFRIKQDGRDERLLHPDRGKVRAVADEKKFKLEDLSKFTGEDGKSYVAVNGKVYDVSGSDLWEDGDHMGAHTAGSDLSAELEEAPHGMEVFDEFPVVGELE
jgi:predicted heme/steroid binding protein